MKRDELRVSKKIPSPNFGKESSFVPKFRTELVEQKKPSKLKLNGVFFEIRTLLTPNKLNFRNVEYPERSFLLEPKFSWNFAMHFLCSAWILKNSRRASF